MSQRLIGPRVFDLERMIAIFHSITNYEVKQSVDVQMQVHPKPENDVDKRLRRWEASS
jgi:Origin recognition complex (ORC) subunit 5 C-terminus